MTEMLAGMQDPLLGPEIQTPRNAGSFEVGDSMFETMGKPPSFAPSSEEMARAMEEVRRRRKVELKEIVSRTYDLSDEAQQTQYVTDLEHIMLGTSLRTHMLIDKPPKQFVADDQGARYIAYLEWAEFRLHEEPVPTVGEPT